MAQNQNIKHAIASHRNLIICLNHYAKQIFLNNKKIVMLNQRMIEIGNNLILETKKLKISYPVLSVSCIILTKPTIESILMNLLMTYNQKILINYYQTKRIF
jgi:hypothetical protein